ncbi:MAG: hypothetical protein AAB472_03830 [Patescibacteria group bacterium]
MSFAEFSSPQTTFRRVRPGKEGRTPSHAAKIDSQIAIFQGNGGPRPASGVERFSSRFGTLGLFKT